MKSIFTTRKWSLGQGNIFRSVCHSVHGGGTWLGTPPRPWPGTPPWDQVHPQDQVHPPGQTPPLAGTKYTPLAGTKYTPWD